MSNLHAAAVRTPHRALSRTTVAGWLALSAIGFCFLTDSGYGPLIPFRGPLRLLVPVLFTIHMLSNRPPPRSVDDLRVSKGLWALALAGVLSSLFCVAPELGLLKLAMYMGVAVPLLSSPEFAAGLIPGTPGFRVLYRVVIVVLALSASQRLIGVPGLFTNPNGIGAFTVFASPLLLYHLNDSNPSKKQRAKYLLMLAVLLAFASASRGASLSLAATLLVYFGLRRSSSLTTVMVLGFGAAFLGFVLLALSDSAGDFAYKGRDTLLDEARVNKYNDTMIAFREAPVLGYGFGLSWLVERRHVAMALRTGRLSWFVGEFGNSTLAILAGGGLLLTLAFGWLLSTILRSTFKSLHTTCRYGRRRDFQLAMFAGLAGMLIHSQSEAWLMAPLNWVTIGFWLYAGLALRVAAPQ